MANDLNAVTGIISRYHSSIVYHLYTLAQSRPVGRTFSKRSRKSAIFATSLVRSLLSKGRSASFVSDLDGRLGVAGCGICIPGICGLVLALTRLADNCGSELRVEIRPSQEALSTDGDFGAWPIKLRQNLLSSFFLLQRKLLINKLN
jgi:hypothetical protein